MSTRINVTVGDGGLLDRNAQQTAANRQAKVLADQRAAAETLGVERRAADRIAAGLDPLTGLPASTPSSASTINRLDQEPAANRRPGGIGWLLPSDFTLSPSRIDCKVSRLKNTGLFPYRTSIVVPPEGFRFESVNGGLAVVNNYVVSSRELAVAAEAEADLSIGANALSFDPVTGTHTGSEGVLARTRVIKPTEVESLSLEFFGQVGTIDRLVGGKFVTWQYFWNPGFFPEGSSLFRTEYTIRRLTFWEDGAPEPSPDPWDDPVIAFGWPQYTSGPILVITNLSRDPGYMPPPVAIKLHFYESAEDAGLNVNIAARAELTLTVPFTGTSVITNNILRVVCSLAPATGLGVSRITQPEGQLFSRQHVKLTVVNRIVRAYLNGSQIGAPFNLERSILDAGKSYYARVFISTGLELLYTGSNTYIRSDSPVYGVRLQTGGRFTTSPTYAVPQSLTGFTYS
jgi:hypothetical protein